MSKEKKEVLVLDDEPLIANTLCKTLESNNYQAYSANSIAQAKEILKEYDIDIYVFDVSLSEGSAEKTSIDFALNVNRNKPRPTLFYTQHSVRTAPDLYKKTRKVEHSYWSPRKGSDWNYDILFGISQANENFHRLNLEKDNSKVFDISYKGVLTFRERQAGNNDENEHTFRLFLRKDEILFISSEGCENGVSMISTTRGMDYLLTSGIGAIARQLSYYRPIGFNFLRVQRSWIINVDKLESWDLDDNTLRIQGYERDIPVGNAFLRDQDCSDLFPFLPAN